MLITTIGLKISESKCLCLVKLIMFLPIKELTFLPPLQIYEGRFTENTHSRHTSVSLKQHIMLVPKHITFLTHLHQRFVSSVTSKTTVTICFDIGFRFRMAIRSYRPNWECLFLTPRPV